MSTKQHSWQVTKAGVGNMTLYVVSGPVGLTSNADRLEALEEILQLSGRENAARNEGHEEGVASERERIRLDQLTMSKAGGKARQAKLTPDMRRKLAQKAVNARWERAREKTVLKKKVRESKP